MRSYFHVALHEIVTHQGKYGDCVETVPTMPRSIPHRSALSRTGTVL